MTGTDEPAGRQRCLSVGWTNALTVALAVPWIRSNRAPEPEPNSYRNNFMPVDAAMYLPLRQP